MTAKPAISSTAMRGVSPKDRHGHAGIGEEKHHHQQRGPHLPQQPVQQDLPRGDRGDEQVVDIRQSEQVRPRPQPDEQGGDGDEQKQAEVDPFKQADIRIRVRPGRSPHIREPGKEQHPEHEEIGDETAGMVQQLEQGILQPLAHHVKQGAHRLTLPAVRRGSLGDGEEELFEVFPVLFDLRAGPHRRDPAIHHDKDLVPELVHAVEHMGADEHRTAPLL